MPMLYLNYIDIIVKSMPKLKYGLHKATSSQNLILAIFLQASSPTRDKFSSLNDIN